MEINIYYILIIHHNTIFIADILHVCVEAPLGKTLLLKIFENTTAKYTLFLFAVTSTTVCVFLQFLRKYYFFISIFINVSPS